MPATINGSPTHVLIVHVVVVLLPLSVLAALALVFVPRTRRAFGVMSVAVALVGCLAVPLAFLTGSKLRGLVPPSALISHHVAMAHQLALVAAAFGLALAGFVAVDVRRRAQFDQLNQVEAFVVHRFFVGWTRPRHTYRTATRIAAIVLTALSVLTAIAVVRAGDSGAKAAWSNRIAAPQH
jgi:hypothetical protein